MSTVCARDMLGNGEKIAVDRLVNMELIKHMFRGRE